MSKCEGCEGVIVRNDPDIWPANGASLVGTMKFVHEDHHARVVTPGFIYYYITLMVRGQMLDTPISFNFPLGLSK